MAFENIFLIRHSRESGNPWFDRLTMHPELVEGLDSASSACLPQAGGMTHGTTFYPCAETHGNLLKFLR